MMALGIIYVPNYVYVQARVIILIRVMLLITVPTRSILKLPSQVVRWLF